MEKIMKEKSPRKTPTKLNNLSLLPSDEKPAVTNQSGKQAKHNSAQIEVEITPKEKTQRRGNSDDKILGPKEKSPRKEEKRTRKFRSVSTRKLRTRSFIAKSDIKTDISSDAVNSSNLAQSSRTSKTTRRRTHSRLPRINTTNTTKEDKKERPEEKTVLGAIKRILEQPWFHGDISKEDADSSLATSRLIEGPKRFGTHGDFLVRVSLSEPVEKHPYTISKVNKKGVIYHQRIFYNEEDNSFVVLTKSEQYPQVTADSIISLIKQLLDYKIVNQPCKRWNYARKYADIFEKKLSQDGGYVDIDEKGLSKEM